jgi:hypothetical protein
MEHDLTTSRSYGLGEPFNVQTSLYQNNEAITSNEPTIFITSQELLIRLFIFLKNIRDGE